MDVHRWQRPSPIPAFRIGCGESRFVAVSFLQFAQHAEFKNHVLFIGSLSLHVIKVVRSVTCKEHTQKQLKTTPKYLH